MALVGKDEEAKRATVWTPSLYLFSITLSASLFGRPLYSFSNALYAPIHPRIQLFLVILSPSYTNRMSDIKAIQRQLKIKSSAAKRLANPLSCLILSF